MSAPVTLEIEQVPLTQRDWCVRALQLAVILFFIAAWEGLGRAGLLDPFYYSRPSLFVPRIADWFTPGNTAGDIWLDIRVTLTETVLGFVIGTLLGLVVGYAFARNRLLGAAFDPLLSMFNAIPRLVLAPVFILAFGIDLASKVALAVTLVFFIVFFATFAAIRDVDQTLIDNVRILGARQRDVTFQVLLPAAFSAIVASLRTSAGFAFARADWIAGRCEQASASDGEGLDRFRGLAPLFAVGPRESAELFRGREPRRAADLRERRDGGGHRAPVGLGGLHGELDRPLDQGSDRGEADEDGGLFREAARHRLRRARRPEGQRQEREGPQGQDRGRDLGRIRDPPPAYVCDESGRHGPGQGLHVQTLRLRDDGRDARREGCRRLHELGSVRHAVRLRGQGLPATGLPDGEGHHRAARWPLSIHGRRDHPGLHPEQPRCRPARGERARENESLHRGELGEGRDREAAPKRHRERRRPLHEDARGGQGISVGGRADRAEGRRERPQGEHRRLQEQPDAVPESQGDRPGRRGRALRQLVRPEGEEV